MAVFFTSDLHIGHTNCAIRHRGFSSPQEHDALIEKNWRDAVGKRDKVFVLGDVGHNKDRKVLEFYADLPGYKHLIMGNHDQCPVEEYRKYFDKVSGIINYNGYWVTHAPIHPYELRRRSNIHGHMHKEKILNRGGSIDRRYINVNVDVRDYKLVNFEDIAQKTVV